MLNIGDFARLGQVSPRMLRHYDEIGLLKPSRVDEQTGYRSYEVAQLARLHRLLVLRDLGFTLEQVRVLLHDDPPPEQLRTMLERRQDQIERDLAEEQVRLRRVEAHLRAIERSVDMPSLDVAVKTTEPVRLAEASAAAPGFGHENLDPLFKLLVPKVLGHLRRAGARPGLLIAYYEEPADDGSVVVHVGFDVASQSVPDRDQVRVVGLPAIRVASAVHHGDMSDIASAYQALVSWIEDSGDQIVGRSRELYHQWDDQHPELSVTELQVPIAP